MKLIGQNEVKIYKLQSENFKFFGQQFGCPTGHLYMPWGNASS